MLRTRLKDIANRTKRDDDVRKNKEQRNFFSKLNERAKRQFYRDLNPVKTGKDKQFWKTFKPIFAGKSTNVSDKIPGESKKKFRRFEGCGIKSM